MTTWQAMARLDALGYSFSIEGGRVKAAIIGEEPENAAELFDIAGRDPTSAADYVRMKQGGMTVVDECRKLSTFDALAIGQAVKRGEVELVGRVVFHRSENAVSLFWFPKNGEAPAALLCRCRKQLAQSLKARLEKMEAQDWWNLSPAEYEAFCKKYAFYTQLLEESEGCYGAYSLEKTR